MSIKPSLEKTLRRDIIRVGQLLYEKSLVVSRDGNISARLAPDRFLVTPSGLCKGMMSEDQLIVIDLDGRRVDTPTEANHSLRPTSETPMHLEVYRQRPDVQAVVHAHPPHTIALSIAGVSLSDCMLPESIVLLGIIRTAPYSTPASPENVEAIRNLIASHDAIVLERHGTLTTGRDPLDAFYNTETLEQIARITYMLRTLGGGQPLPPHQVEKLMAQRLALGLARPDDAATFHRFCGVCPDEPADTPENDLVDQITQQVLARLADNKR